MAGDVVNSEFPVKNTKSIGILLSFVVLWNSVRFDIVIYNVFLLHPYVPWIQMRLNNLKNLEIIVNSMM